MTKDEIEYKAYLFFKEKGLEYVDNIDELIEYCRDFAYPIVSYFEEKIADLKANFDYILEGKENEYREERKKLCDDFENMKACLESKIAEIEKQVNDLKETNAILSESCTINHKDMEYKVSVIEQRNKRIAELEQQIEKMKCCGNCNHFNFNEPNYCHKGVYRERQYVCSEWEFGN